MLVKQTNRAIAKLDKQMNDLDKQVATVRFSKDPRSNIQPSSQSVKTARRVVQRPSCTSPSSSTRGFWLIWKSRTTPGPSQTNRNNASARRIGVDQK
jgi:hypothetical protein